MTKQIGKWFKFGRKEKPARCTTTTTLALENLEDRRVFAVALAHDLDTGVLRVTGTSGNDHVEIRENHVRDRLQVFEDGIQVGATLRSRDVKQISVRLNGGDDTFDYKLQSDATRNRVIGINLGDGNDAANFYGNGRDIQADLFWNVIGGIGNDTAWSNVGDIRNANARFMFDLGAGDDRMPFFLNGNLEGRAALSVQASGGNDNDSLTFFAARSQGVDVDNDAKLEVNLDGGNGIDILGFYYQGENDGQIRARIKGGNGYDYLNFQENLSDVEFAFTEIQEARRIFA